MVYLISGISHTALRLLQRVILRFVTAPPYRPQNFHCGAARLGTIQEIGPPGQGQHIGRRVVPEKLQPGSCVPELGLQQKRAGLAQFQCMADEFRRFGEWRVGDDPLAMARFIQEVDAGLTISIPVQVGAYNAVTTPPHDLRHLSRAAGRFPDDVLCGV